MSIHRPSQILAIVVALFMSASFAFATGSKESGAQKPTALSFLEVMTSPSRTELIRSLITKYEADHPGVTINLISPPYEQADNKLTVMLSAKSPLDVVEVRDITVKQYANNNFLASLEPYLAKWSDTSQLLPLTLQAARTVNNTAFLLPEFFYIKALFVRTDILQKLGVTQMPTTIAQMYALAKQVTNPANNQYGYDIRGQGAPYNISDPLILSDIPNVDPNNLYQTTDGKSVFDNPQFVKSLQAYIDLYKSAVPSDGVNWGFNEQVNSFVSGITPFLIQDPDTVPLLNQHLKADQYTVVPFPVGASGKAYLSYGFAGLGIPAYSANKDAAWQFIAWFSAPQQNAEFCKQYGPLPNSTTAFKTDPYFSTGVYKAWATETSDPGKYVFVRPPLDSPKYPGWGQVEQQYMQAALLGQMRAADAAAKWAAYWK